jgi:hypothetical protein
VFQNVGEIDPFFAASFFEELGMMWEVCDRKGRQHNFQFNGLLNQPRLTTGWNTLNDQYSWTEPQQLSFLYYGESKFYMLINEETNYNTPSYFPPYHSNSSVVSNNPKFLMHISHEDVNSQTKVSLNFLKYGLINIYFPI